MGQVQSCDLGSQAPAFEVRFRPNLRVAAAEDDGPAADPLHEGEQLRSGLLGDDLAEERPQQANLAAERAAGATDPRPMRLRTDGREPGVGRCATGDG
jgi:hypothetical protein